MKRSLEADTRQGSAPAADPSTALDRARLAPASAGLESTAKIQPAPALSEASIATSSSGLRQSIALERERARAGKFAALRAEVRAEQLRTGGPKKPPSRAAIRKKVGPGGGFFKLEGLSITDRLINFIASSLKALEFLFLRAIGRRPQGPIIQLKKSPDAEPKLASKQPGKDQKKVAPRRAAME